jgi:hypothetical protein
MHTSHALMQTRFHPHPVPAASHALDDRQHTGDFLLWRDARRAWARALAADVYDARTGQGHRARVLNGGADVGVGATVAEGIRGDVEDAHDVGAGANLPDLTVHGHHVHQAWVAHLCTWVRSGKVRRSLFRCVCLCSLCVCVCVYVCVRARACVRARTRG